MSKKHKSNKSGVLSANLAIEVNYLFGKRAAKISPQILQAWIANKKSPQIIAMMMAAGPELIEHIIRSHELSPKSIAGIKAELLGILKKNRTYNIKQDYTGYNWSGVSLYDLLKALESLGVKVDFATALLKDHVKNKKTVGGPSFLASENQLIRRQFIDTSNMVYREQEDHCRSYGVKIANLEEVLNWMINTTIVSHIKGWSPMRSIMEVFYGASYKKGGDGHIAGIRTLTPSRDDAPDLYCCTLLLDKGKERIILTWTSTLASGAKLGVIYNKKPQ